MRMLDVVLFQSGYADPEPTVEDFARRHDLFHLMAITRALPGSGLLQFVSLYRYRRSPAFDPAHRVLFEQFSAHLMQRWSARIALLLAGGDPRRHGSAAGAADEHGLVDASGDFIHVGAPLALLLYERFAQWDGTHLPEDLTQAVRQAPAVLRLGRRRLSTQRCGGLVLLSVAPQRRMGTAAAARPECRAAVRGRPLPQADRPRDRPDALDGADLPARGLPAPGGVGQGGPRSRARTSEAASSQRLSPPHLQRVRTDVGRYLWLRPFGRSKETTWFRK